MSGVFGVLAVVARHVAEVVKHRLVHVPNHLLVMEEQIALETSQNVRIAAPMLVVSSILFLEGCVITLIIL